jgi:hypothetical protein
MASDPQRERKTSPLVLTLVVLAGFGGVCLVCGGALAALSVSSFQRFEQQSRAAEADMNLRALREGITIYAMQEALDSSGAFATHGLPPSLPLTPSTPSPQRQTWPTSADPLWRELGLYTDDGVYYAYEVVSDRAAGTITIRVVGDLDGDGTRSERVLHGRYDAAFATITWDASPTVTDPLE